MNRTEALDIASKHVEKLSTNARGYQDGVNLAGKVAAVETLARFLMEQDAGDAHRVVHVPDIESDQPGTQYRDKDGDVWTRGDDGLLRMRPEYGGDSVAYVVDEFSPLTRLPRA